jgi:hypothetical protein
LGIISVDFEVIYSLLARNPALFKYQKKIWNKMGTVNQLSTDLKKFT